MAAFSIILSKTLTVENIISAFHDLIPPGLKIDVFPVVDTPDDVGAIWAWLTVTTDPAWPCMVDVVYSDECQLKIYPDLQLAEYLAEHFSCQVLTDIHPFAGDLDPLDPYWFMAYVDGQWYLADTVNTPLMGTDMDGEERGNEAVKLVRLITIPNIYS